jgi:hypothetical protein
VIDYIVSDEVIDYIVSDVVIDYIVSDALPRSCLSSLVQVVNRHD